MASAFIDRYLAGEHVEVWDELRALGRAEPVEAVGPEAAPVVEATMQRAASNLRAIVDGLRGMGYRFAWDGPDAPLGYPWTAPGDEVLPAVEQVERALGPLPLVLVGLYEHIGAVSLRGSMPGWSPATYVFEDVISGPRFGGYSDPLDLFGAEITLGYLTAAGELDPRYRDADGSYRIYLASDAIASAGFSGGCHMIRLDNAIDPTVDLVEGHEGISLVEYLRWVFAWAGFPGFETMDTVPDEVQELRTRMVPM